MISLAKIFADVQFAYRSNLKIWLLLGTITGALAIPTYIFDPESFVSILLGIVSFLLLVFITPGTISMGMLTARGKKPTLKEIPDKSHLWLKVLGFMIVYFLIVALGLVALIIPGIYLAARYWSAQYILVEQPNVRVFDSFIRAQNLVKGKILSLIGVFLVIGLIYIVLTIAPTIVIDLLDWSDIASAIANTVVSIIFFPIGVVGVASAYVQLAAAHKSSK